MDAQIGPLGWVAFGLQLRLDGGGLGHATNERRAQKTTTTASTPNSTSSTNHCRLGCPGPVQHHSRALEGPGPRQAAESALKGLHRDRAVAGLAPIRIAPRWPDPLTGPRSALMRHMHWNHQQFQLIPTHWNHQQ